MRRSVSPLFRILSSVLAACLLLQAPVRPAAQEGQTAPATQPARTAEPPKETEAVAAPEPEEAPAPKKPAAVLRGKLSRSDRKTPLAGAVVHAIAADGNVISSAPADSKGHYELPELPPGTYRLAVSTEEGVFSVELPVGITSAHPFTVDLVTVPAEAASGTVPGLEAPPRGFAYILQGTKTGGTSFWRGPKGIILLVASAAAVGLILAESNKNEKEKPVSPSVP